MRLAREFATLEELGPRHIERLTMMGRKRSTLMDHESTLRVHLAPFFCDGSVATITAGDVERFIANKRRDGCAPNPATSTSRSVPLADRVAAALDGHCRHSQYAGEDELAFGHPQPHIRHSHGRCGRSDARAAGVDG